MNKNEKRQATLAKKRQERKAQSVKIGDWEISRFDDLNWCIQHKGILRGYYGSLSQALNALPAKMLDQASFNSLKDIQRNVRAIHEAIEGSLNPI